MSYDVMSNFQVKSLEKYSLTFLFLKRLILGKNDSEISWNMTF